MELTAAFRIIWKAMVDHKLFDKGWSFQWDNAKSRCGQCRFEGRIITISRHYAAVNDEANIRDTILHEIAHALVGPGHHHDWVWQSMARQIGARPERCATTDAQVRGNYIGQCVGCNKEIHRYRRPRYLDIPGFYSHTACKRAGKPSDIKWTRA